MSTTDKVGYIKCPKCGSVSYTDDLEKLNFECSTCGNKFDLRMYHHCPECNMLVGVIDNPLTLKQFGRDVAEVFKLYLRPRKLIRGIIEENRHKVGNHFTCPSCGIRYAICPYCKATIEGNDILNEYGDDVLFCPECGKDFIVYGY